MKNLGVLVGFSCLYFFVFLGCSGQSENPSKLPKKEFLDVQPSSKTLQFSTTQEASDFANSIKLNCDDCPESLGLMAFKDGSTIALCNGVFVNTNLFITNLHCLPSSVRRIGSSCEGGRFFRPNSDAKIKCKSVLDLSAQDPEGKFNRPDYVALEIENNDEIGNIVFNLSVQKPNTEVYAYVSKAKTKNQAHFVYEKKSCKVIHSSVVNPYSNSNHKATYALKNCRFSPGDSGSPIFTGDGKLVGLHSQQMVIAETSEYFQLSETQRLDFARGTLSFCFYHLINNNFSTPRECQELYNSEREVDMIFSLKSSQMQGINQRRSELVQNWIKSHTDLFFFELNQTSFEDPENREGVVDILEIEIQCVRPKYKDREEDVAHSLDRWVTYLYYDEDLKPRYKIESEEVWSQVQIMNPKIDDQAHFNWEREIDGDTLQSARINRPWCEY